VWRRCVGPNPLRQGRLPPGRSRCSRPGPSRCPRPGCSRCCRPCRPRCLRRGRCRRPCRLRCPRRGHQGQVPDCLPCCPVPSCRRRAWPPSPRRHCLLARRGCHRRAPACRRGAPPLLPCGHHAHRGPLCSNGCSIALLFDQTI